MKKFTKENTTGYTDNQLDELNRRLDIIVGPLNPDDTLYDELVQAACEQVLADFDPPGA